MSAAPATVLLTGVGLPGGPDIIRALRADPVLRARVVGVDTDPRCPGRYLCDAFHVVPGRDDPGYVESVATVAESEGAGVIYPLPTFDQELFAAARADLEGRGIVTPVSPLEAVRVCNDKWLLYERLREFAPDLVPETVRVHSAEELADRVASFGYPEDRVCIRPRVSRGAMGIRLLDAGPARLTALLEENPWSLITSLAEVQDTLSHAEQFPEYLVQEYLPGVEWDVDALCRAGEPVVVVTRRNDSMMVSVASRSVLEPFEEVAEASRAIVAELGLDAVVNLAFRPDSDGRVKLLEINPRIPMSVLSAMAGGINLVGLAVRQALGERIAPADPEWGGQFMLHFQSVVTDADGNLAIDSPAP